MLQRALLLAWACAAGAAGAAGAGRRATAGSWNYDRCGPVPPNLQRPPLRRAPRALCDPRPPAYAALSPRLRTSSTMQV